MSGLIPIAILGVIVSVLGFYFALKERRESSSTRSSRHPR